MGKQLKPVIGTKYGFYKVICDEIYMIKNKTNNHHRGHIKVLCTKCNFEHLIRADILKSGQASQCRACSNKEKYLKNLKDKKVAHKGYSTGHRGTGDLSKTHLLHIKYSALSRNLEWDCNYMTTENLWNLFLKQSKKCALSGLDITLKHGHKNEPISTNHRNLDYAGWTASLDRIDSSKGYVEGNVQWVHRNINIMKNSYSEDYFIKLCKLIVNYDNQKPS